MVRAFDRRGLPVAFPVYPRIGHCLRATLIRRLPFIIKLCYYKPSIPNTPMPPHYCLRPSSETRLLYFLDLEMPQVPDLPESQAASDARSPTEKPKTADQIPLSNRVQQERQQKLKNEQATRRLSPDRQQRLETLLNQFHLPGVAIGPADDQPRGPNDYAGIWHNGSFLGTVICPDGPRFSVSSLQQELSDLLQQTGVTLDYYSVRVGPQSTELMNELGIKIQKQPGQHVLLYLGKPLLAIDFTTDRLEIYRRGAQLIIDAHNHQGGADRLMLAQGAEPKVQHVPKSPRKQTNQKPAQTNATTDSSPELPIRRGWLLEVLKDLGISSSPVTLGPPEDAIRAPVEQYAIYVKGRLVGHLYAGYENARPVRDLTKYTSEYGAINFKESGFKQQLRQLEKPIRAALAHEKCPSLPVVFTSRTELARYLFIL